jgi:hypothetical protein
MHTVAVNIGCVGCHTLAATALDNFIPMIKKACDPKRPIPQITNFGKSSIEPENNPPFLPAFREAKCAAVNKTREAQASLTRANVKG